MVWLRHHRLGLVAAIAAFSFVFPLMSSAAQAAEALLNVSYDATRELYRAINEQFIADWKAKTGETIAVRVPWRFGRQARAVIDGSKRT